MDFQPFSMIISIFQMKQIELISFDAEGTVVTPDFSQAIWHEAIPALYAKKNRLDLVKAKSHIHREYDMVGDRRLEWYDIEYWFKYLGLGSSEPVIRSCLGKVVYYPEVTEVLSCLAKEYKLIVASGTPIELLNFLLRDIRPYFVRIFSSISHYKQLKSPDFYLKICEDMGVKPGQVIHVGDNWQFDLLNARQVGITAFYIDRLSRNHQESLSDLTELQHILLSQR